MSERAGHSGEAEGAAGAGQVGAPTGRRFRLRTMLLYVNLVVLVLPIAGLWMLRIYENELIRRTEAELFAQGAFVRAIWLEQLAAAQPLDQIEHAHRADRKYRAKLRARGLRPFTITANINHARMHAPASPPQDATTTPPETMRAVGATTSAILRRAQRSTLAGIRVVDHLGVVVASTRGELGKSLVERDEVRRALRGEHVRLFRQRVSDSPTPSLKSISRRSSVRLFVALPITHEGRVLGAVVLSRTPMSLARSLYDERVVLLSFVAALVLAVFFMSLYTSHTIVKPVHQLIRQTERLKAGDEDAAVPLESPVTYEVELLSHAIVDMALALDERAEYIKTFASSVSHEFKTPLAGIRGTVELLQDHLDTMSPAERERFLANIDRDAARLQRLVGRLLELARADVLQPDAQVTDALLVLDEVIDRYVMDGLQLDFELDDDIQGVRMAQETLDTILSNLIDNARQHGGEHVTFAAKLVEEQVGDRAQVMLQIDVTDDGPGVSAANRDRIFEPFFTTARDAGGTGLGLAVVRSLLRAHGGDILLRSSSPSTFRVQLPHTSLSSTTPTQDQS